MATTNHSLTVTTRAKTGTTSAHAVRHAGKVPGVIFGHGSAPIAIELDARAFDDAVLLDAIRWAKRVHRRALAAALRTRRGA